MDSIELGVLDACQEVVRRQRELLPALAAVLNVPEDEVLYAWALRRCKQRGCLPGTDWAFFFHGLECDLRNGADGRFLRIDFGPRGRVDTFTAWGVLQFIMTAVAPWPEFPELQSWFAKGEPPYDQSSGSMEKMCQVWDRLAAQGAFENADQGLLEFAAEHTARGPDGLNYVTFPPGTPETTRVDCAVANRQLLSPSAGRRLKAASSRSAAVLD